MKGAHKSKFKQEAQDNVPTHVEGTSASTTHRFDEVRKVSLTLSVSGADQ